MATLLKDAVENAIAFARESLGIERTRDIRLEEIEVDTINGHDCWLITLSMLGEQTLPDVLRNLKTREYKVFTVRQDNLQVTAMKIRELSTS